MNKNIRICELSFLKAIEAIKGTKTVMFKSGVWNKYEEEATDYVIERIKKSGYGAGVDFNPDTNMYYVCCPCAADMW